MSTAVTRPVSLLGRTVSALVLVIAALSVHVWSLADGTVLDDYWHQHGLSTHGWSPGELMRSLRIEPTAFTHFWWAERDVRWDYGRPLFILAMKFVYVTLGGENPFSLHLFAVLLHVASVLMIARIAGLLTGRGDAALIAGLAFAIYPHAVITVAWPSSLNAVLVTALMLSSWLLYWKTCGVPASSSGFDARASANDGRVSLLMLMFLLWLAALLVRENALMLPPILLLLDYARGGWTRLRGQWTTYAIFAIVGAAFILWRLSVVTEPMPDVYVRRPNGDWLEYGPWLLAKLMHYLTASIWLAPMTVGPTGRFNPWTEATGDCLLMLGLLLALGGGYFHATRRTPGAWTWAAWVFLGVLPVLPMIATPHSGYIPGVGLALALGTLATTSCRGGPAEPTANRHVIRTVIGVYLVGMAVMSMFNRWMWTGMIAAERYALKHVEAAPPEPVVQDVFFINLPFVNVYAKPALDRRIGPDFHDKRVHVLCYAPELVLVNTDCIVETLDERTLRVSAVQRPFFSRLLGRFLIEAFRGRVFESGQMIPGDAFETRIGRVDEQGVWSIEFEFVHSLSDPRYAFYLSSPSAGAVRLRFEDFCGPPGEHRSPPTQENIERLLRGDAGLAAEWLERLAADGRLGDDQAAFQAREELLGVVQFVAAALGAPELFVVTRPDMTPADWRAAADFWAERVDQRVMAETWGQWEYYSPLLKLRVEVPHGRMWAGRIIRTDLYLTGRPFPGPRTGLPGR